MALTDAERVFVESLRTVRAKLMDTVTGLDDTIAEIEQTAAARHVPFVGLVCRCLRSPEPHDPQWHGGVERALWDHVPTSG